jgi:uncharacterized protein (DUF1800 family)
MTPREKIAHVYRRFGFGATVADLDEGEKRGLRETIHHLIDYDTVDEKFPVSPFEFIWRPKDEPDISTWRYKMWWVFRMLATQRPLQERLTLFWHNHFAVSDAKVEDGPMMLNYINALRENAAGPFVEVLRAASKDPAMMRYLDMERSINGHPNENFAREVMELFTLGIGNYTEEDVKAASHAFTGWGYIHIFWELPGNTTTKVDGWLTYRRPFTSFTSMPAMHDPAPKTFLGEHGPLDGDETLNRLAKHPATAKRICRKLWEHFAYEKPDSGVVDRLVRVYDRTNGNTRAILHAIADAPEFWSEKCVRRQVKSPVDLCVAVARQMGAGERLLSFRAPNANERSILPDDIPNNLYGIIDRMDKAGLALMYPPNVAGWHWGEAWISSAAMLERYRYRGMFIYGPKGPDVGSKKTLDFVMGRNPKGSDDIARAIAEFFDIDLPETGHDVLATAVLKRGGLKSLADLNVWAATLDHLMMLLMAAPEAHVC